MDNVKKGIKQSFLLTTFLVMMVVGMHLHAKIPVLNLIAN